MKLPRKYLFFCLLIAFFYCCGQTPFTEENKDSNTTKLENEFQKGPLHISISFSPKNPSIVDSITCNIIVSIDPKYTVEMPQFSENLGRLFYILDFSSERSKTKDKKKVYSQYYKLEALISGPITIPPIKFFYQKGTEVDKKSAYSTETDPIKIEIKAVQMENHKQGIYEIQDVLALPKSNQNMLIALASTLGLVILLFSIKFMTKSKIKEEIVETRTAEEIAWEKLKILMDKKYIEKKDYQSFYFALTMIVRQYIEYKYSIYASGQTTEEFLKNLTHTAIFNDSEQTDFFNFLEATDFVKYAAQEPEAEEVEKVFETAKTFMNLKN